MFDFVRNNKRAAQLVLALITLPFAFWGVDSYVKNAGSANDVASVDGIKISVQEFHQALQSQQDRMRGSLGRQVPPEMLDNPEIRHAVLDNLVTQKLLQRHAGKAHLGVSDEQLYQIISSAPELQENGQFSKSRYEQLVAAQGMSKEMFEARVRQDLTNQQLLGVVNAAAIPGHESAGRLISAVLQERTIGEAVHRVDDFASQVKLAPDAAKAFYDSNRKLFELPERIKAEYLVLDKQALAAQLNPSDDEIKAYYNSHADQFKQPEERRASHILINVDKAAPEAAVNAAKAKAEALLAEVKKNPASFAAVAKQNSQDPGSANKGGDLDWFRRGMMVKAFDDAVFAMKEGQISELVRSDFGFHIITVTGIHGGRARSLDEVKTEVIIALREQTAQKKFAEMSVDFTNMVYEQADSLKPAVDKFHLAAQQTGWFAKNAKEAGALSHPKLLEALFSTDAIQNKRNTEAVEVAPGVLISARVAEHSPATVKAFEEVKAEIEKRLTREEAAKLAKKSGEDELARLSKGEALSLKWAADHAIARLGAQGMAPDAVKAIFKADVSKLPAYAGAVLPDGSYALYRISQIKAFAGGEDKRATQLRQQYERVAVSADMSAWLAALRQRYPVEINQKLLDAKDR
ncbi:MAG TPA: SurA N-terminal domain-containing protein [Rhodocyclaceae bacterium]